MYLNNYAGDVEKDLDLDFSVASNDLGETKVSIFFKKKYNYDLNVIYCEDDRIETERKLDSCNKFE